MAKNTFPTNIEVYLVRQPDENLTYLHVPGNVVFNYHGGVLKSLSEDSETLDLMDEMVLGLKELKSDKIKLVPVSRNTIIHLRELGGKVGKLYLSSQNQVAKLDPKKKEQLRKAQLHFQGKGRQLMDIIERDLEKERKTKEICEKITDSNLDEIVDSVLAKKGY